MIPEGPIFGFTSTDPIRLEIHATVAGAVDHLVERHRDDEEFLQGLVCFDGLARPVDIRPLGNRFRLVVSNPLPDPWQVRGRVLRALAQALANLKEQSAGRETISLRARDREMELATEPLLDRVQQVVESIASAKNWCEFALRCADICAPRDGDDNDSWFCCLLGRPCC